MFRATRSVLLSAYLRTSRYRIKKFWSPLIIGMLLCCMAFAFAPLMASRRTSGDKITSDAFSKALPVQSNPRVLNSLYSRLTLQPQADRHRRLLGKRFLAPGREVSVMSATLTLGAERYLARISRIQNDDGESLSIGLNGGPASLTWNDKDGAKIDGNTATGNQRALIERVALDSPDQFILAQLRGAGYFTVAQAVRPAEVAASSSYSGPVWDLVRVSEPSTSPDKPPGSWRLYYVNTSTGLIDRILSQEQERVITAEISGWVNQGDEISPTHITWKQGKQTLMEMIITDISRGPKQ
jgi:hypothetical protein